MIAKISNGSSFGGIVNYANDIKDKGTTILASRGIDLTNNYTIAQSFKVQAMMNRRVEKCVGHFALSFPPEDAKRCTDGFMRKLAMEYMKKMGITDTQFIIFRHHDHDHQHVHVVYNRVNDSGRTISDGCDVERAIAICQAMTRQYGLHWGEGKKKVNRDRLKGKAAVKYAIYDAAQKALAGSHTWKDFIKLMKEQGIEVKLQPRGEGKSPGVIFTKGRVSMSGTQVDRESLTFGSLFWKLCYVNDVLPDDQKFHSEHVDARDEMERHWSFPRLPDVPSGEPDGLAWDDDGHTVGWEGDESLFDEEAIAETMSNATDAAVDILMGPTPVVSPVGGGGGGSGSSKKKDDDDDEKKRRYGSRHR